MTRSTNVIVKILKYVSYISGVCLIAIMFVAFFNVLGEKIFHKGIPASTEIIQYLHIPVVFLACGYVTLDTGHTKIDLLSKHLPQGVQFACNLIGNLIAVFITSFVGYRGLVQMQKFMATHAKSSTTGFGFAKWPFGADLLHRVLPAGAELRVATVRLFVKKPAAEEEKKEAEV